MTARTARVSAFQTSVWILTALMFLTLADCGKPEPDDPTSEENGEGSKTPGEQVEETAAEQGPPPGEAFQRFCRGQTWNEGLQPATVGKLSGTYAGKIGGINPSKPFSAGVMETMKVIPAHPFWVTHVRVAFAGGSGPARIRLMTTLGRSYPGSWPDLSRQTHDVMPPVTVDIQSSGPDEWVEIDVSDKGVYLLPTQHYMIVYEHLAQEPLLAVEKVADNTEFSRALFFLPGDAMAHGLGGHNYRLELEGYFFCAWTSESYWFSRDTEQLFFQETTARLALTDINCDGCDDLIIHVAREVGGQKVNLPAAFLGDGKGRFAKAAFEPFPDLLTSSMVVYGDIDNDGDVDAVAFTNITVDRDGDKYDLTGRPPDCDDTDAKVHPKAEDIKNGKDDDCDGVADDGQDTSDADGDGYSIAGGDRDDTHADVHPMALEILDGRDNDCDGKVDEDFHNRVLLNNGQGEFTTLPEAGVEVLDPTTAAAFSDANGDGILDLYWGNWLKHYPDDPAVQDRYFQGKGDGTFEDKQAEAGLVLPRPFSVYGVRWTDYNNDGWQDLFVGNYHLYPNQLWENLCNGKFDDVARETGADYDDIPPPPYFPSGLTGGHSYGIEFGDLDSDGDMDYYVSNLAHPRAQPWSDVSMLLINQGAPDYSFENRFEESGFLYDEGDLNVAFGDFDNDMDLDIVVVSTYTHHYSRFYRNDGEASFIDVTYETNTAVHDSVGVIWADVDRDGDLDLFIVGKEGKRRCVHLFVNRIGQRNNWIEFVLQGTSSNRDGIGARVAVTAGGITQMRDARGGGGGHSNTQHPRTVHFGLAKNDRIEKITVRWVGGKIESISCAKPNGLYKIVEGTGRAVPLD